VPDQKGPRKQLSGFVADDHGCLPYVPTLLPLTLGMLGSNTSGGSQSRRCFTVAFRGTGERGKQISRWRIQIQIFPRLFARSLKPSCVVASLATALCVFVAPRVRTVTPWRSVASAVAFALRAWAGA